MNDEIRLLKSKIEKKFPKAQLLGDIPIDDNEYALLLAYFREKSKIFISDHYRVVDQLYTIALIQIGIREYDGGYWPHVTKILGLEKLSPTHHQNLSQPLIATLKQYKKKIASEHDYVKNILMHGFVSNHYVKSLLDYLYRFYSIDIERDLKSDIYKPALNFLIDVIQKDEENDSDQSNRSYILNKYTIHGINHSSKRSISMKFRWLLKTIDRYWFGEPINRNSSSRLIRLVENWFDTSDLKRDVLRASEGERKRGLRHSSTPYIRYDYRRNSFTLHIPGQSFIARSNDTVDSFLSINGVKHPINLGLNEESTLLKTFEKDVPIQIEDIFTELKVLFITSKDSRVFPVTCGEPVVFFDSKHISTHIYNKKQAIQEGFLYGFAHKDTQIKVFGNSEQEIFGIYKRVSFELGAYDYIIANNTLYTIRAELEDGLSKKGFVENATTNGLPIYSEQPLLFLRVTESKIAGSAVVINGHIHRLADLNISITEHFPDGNIQAILSLSDIVKDVGIYEVHVEIPAFSRKEYKFAYLPGLNFNFDNKPFIFVNPGFISFDEKNIVGKYEKSQDVYTFEIRDDTRNLEFIYHYNAKTFEIMIDPPIFKWSIDNVNFRTESLGQLWHSEFPYSFDVKFNDGFSVVIAHESDDEKIVEAVMNESGKYHCDLTKFKTWLFDNDISPVEVMIQYKDVLFPFASVFTKTEITSISPLRYNETNRSIEGNFEKYGFDNLFLSIKHDQTNADICQYLPLKDTSFSIKSNDLAGDYIIEIYISRKGFGNNYKSIYKGKNRLVTNNLEGLSFSVIAHYCGITRFQVDRFLHPHFIEDVKKKEADIYVGKMKKVIIEQIDGKFTRSTISLCDVKIDIKGTDKIGWIAGVLILDEFEGEEDVQCFLYDRQSKELMVEEDSTLTSKQCYIRYADLVDRTYDLTIYKPEVV